MKKVYVIELDAGSSTSRRFYVGTSVDVENRYEKHARGEGCDYTRQFKPKYIVEVYETAGTEKEALEMEDAVTEKYILAYGSGVRGGHYLNESDVLSVFMKDRHQRDLCYRCGEAGHYSSKCSSTTTTTLTTKATNLSLSAVESIEDKKVRLSQIKVSLWSSGSSKYADSINESDPHQDLQVTFGAQTHANNKNHKVQVGALFCDTSLGGWTVRGIVKKLEFDNEKNYFKLSISPIPETGLSIRSTPEQHGKVGIAKALELPIPSYNWTSSGIVVHM